MASSLALATRSDFGSIATRALRIALLTEGAGSRFNFSSKIGT